MSSTLNISSILSSIASLEKQLAALKSQLGAAESVSVPVSAPVKEKKERKRSDGPPSAWRVFADHVRSVLKDNGYGGKALGVECVQFCSTLKDENAELTSWADADILARRAAWSAPEVSKQKAAGKSWRKSKTGSSSASVVSTDSAPAPAPAPAPVAEVSDGEAVSVASSSKKPGPPKGRKWSDEAKAAAAAKRAAKKAAKTEANTNAAASVVAERPPLPPSPDQSDDEDELSGFQRMSLGGVKYWVNLESGHCYRRNPEDDSRGEWAGLFSRSPKPSIDDSVPEPASELTFTDLDALD